MTNTFDNEIRKAMHTKINAQRLSIVESMLARLHLQKTISVSSNGETLTIYSKTGYIQESTGLMIMREIAKLGYIRVEGDKVFNLLSTGKLNSITYYAV